MTEKMKAFLEALESNSEIKAQVLANPPKTKEEIIALAASIGVALSNEDITPNMQQLSDGELDKIAGGSGPVIFCDLLWGVLINVH